MNIKKLIICLVFALSIIIVFEISKPYYIHAQKDDVVVVVHKDRPKLTKAQIKRIFKGDVDRWPDGTAVKIFINADKSITEDFCNKYLKIKPSYFNSLWLKKEIRDGIPRPRKIPSNLILTMVSNSPIFIGYIRKSETKRDIVVLE